MPARARRYTRGVSVDGSASSPPSRSDSATPASVDQATAWAARMAARRAHATSRPSTNARRYRINLRRFAGPAVYRDQVAHLRIAHITDQHIGRITPVEVQQTAVEMTNAERPDVVLITGDFVCHSQAYLDQLTEVMRSFEAPVLAVLGNHDHWSGADEVRHALERGGVEVLCNRNTVITLGHERLQIVGLDDAYTGHARREEALKGLRKDLPTIALSHIAEEADYLWRHGVPLVLSGHTHGGQVTLARLHELSVGMIAGHKYVHGLYGSRRHESERRRASPHAAPDGTNEPLGAVYVGAGIGAAVVPFRFGERGRREVTIFELGCEPGDFVEHHAEQEPMRGRKPTERTIARRAAAVIRKRLRREQRAANGR